MRRSRESGRLLALGLVMSLVAIATLHLLLAVVASASMAPSQPRRRRFVGFATSTRDPFSTTTTQATTGAPSLLGQLLELVSPETENPGVNRTVGDAGVVESALQLEAG